MHHTSITEDLLKKITKKEINCMHHKEIIIYTTQSCPYCIRAKKLLDSKGASYKEIDVGNNHDLRLTMVEKAGGRSSVPQIFIGDFHVGGSDDLYDLDRKGKLDPLLEKCS